MAQKFCMPAYCLCLRTMYMLTGAKCFVLRTVANLVGEKIVAVFGVFCPHKYRMYVVLF